MRENFPACFAITVQWEGGDRLSLDRRDPGNWTGGQVGKGALRGTKYGIAASAHPALAIETLTADQAQTIYREEYWRPIGGDGLPVGLDLAGFDACVMSGAGRARKWIDAGLRGSADLAGAVHAVCAARLSFVEGLKTFVSFGRGWARRIAGIEAEAIRMAAIATRGAAAAPTVLRQKAQDAAQKAARADRAGKAGAVATAGGTAATAHPAAAGAQVWILAALAAAALVGAAVIFWRIHVQRARAQAFADLGGVHD